MIWKICPIAYQNEDNLLQNETWSRNESLAITHYSIQDGTWYREKFLNIYDILNNI